MGTCVGLKEALFEPSLLIADAIAQSVIETLWTFSTQAVAYGALLLLAWLDGLLVQHRCRIKGWQYSQAAMQVGNF